MANYTRKAIIQTFEEMLTEKSFSKITVTEIITRCEISSNTFYYHFHDIYDLLNVWLESKKDIYLKNMDTDWQSALTTLLYAMQNSPKLINHLANSLSREYLERFIFDNLEPWFYEWVRNAKADESVPDDVIRKLASFCCYSLMGFLIKFVWNQGTVDIEAEVERISYLYDGCIEYVIKKTKEPTSPFYEH